MTFYRVVPRLHNRVNIIGKVHRSFTTSTAKVSNFRKKCSPIAKVAAITITAGGITNCALAEKSDASNNINLSKSEWAIRVGALSAVMGTALYFFSRWQGKEKAAVYPDPGLGNRLSKKIRLRVEKKLKKVDLLIARADKEKREDLLEEALDVFQSTVEAQSNKMGLCDAVARSSSLVSSETVSIIADLYFRRGIESTKIRKWDKAIDNFCTSM